MPAGMPFYASHRTAYFFIFDSTRAAAAAFYFMVSLFLVCYRVTELAGRLAGCGRPSLSLALSVLSDVIKLLLDVTSYSR
jgi:hypothetical protein